jgi:uncharacterized metal-binding protein YceD (DUF177 family)
MKRSKGELPTPEWSHNIEADKAGIEIVDIEFSPPLESIAPLCKRLNIDSLESCLARIKFKRQQGNLVVYVQGEIEAAISQRCVKTLAPVVSKIQEPFEAWFSDPAQAVSLNKVRQMRDTEKHQGEAPMMEEEDDPEPIIDGQIDVGELATQFLSLAINPYPYAEGVRQDGEEEGIIAIIPEERRNPFAALRDLKTKQSDEDI